MNLTDAPPDDCPRAAKETGKVPPFHRPFSLSVVVPVYNEVASALQLLRSVRTLHPAAQIIVVDDGSEDGSAELLEAGQRSLCYEFLRHHYNRGKGAAIRTGLERATSDLTIIQDADLEYDPADYLRLFRPIERGEADAVFGSRFLANSPRESWRWCWDSGVSILNLAVRALYGKCLTDEATCYKMIPTTLLQSLDLQCERFEFCPEVTAKLIRCGARIAEVPISYAPRRHAEGKKIRFRDGLEALRTLWRFRRWKHPRCLFGSAMRFPASDRGRRGISLIELLVVLGITMVLVSLAIPAVQAAREAARRTQCQNQLRQIGLAFTTHHDAWLHFPTNGWGWRWVGGAQWGFGESQPGGWAFNVLPYVEQIGLRDRATGGSATAEVVGTPVGLYYCPSRRPMGVYPFTAISVMPHNSDPIVGAGKTDYAVCAGDDSINTPAGPADANPSTVSSYAWPPFRLATGISYVRTGVNLASILDGSSNMLMVGEKYIARNHSTDGLDPGDDQSAFLGDDADNRRWTDATPLRDTLFEDIQHFGSSHPSTCQFVLADGSVRPVQYSVDATVFKNLGNRHDGNGTEVP